MLKVVYCYEKFTQIQRYYEIERRLIQLLQERTQQSGLLCDEIEKKYFLQRQFKVHSDLIKTYRDNFQGKKSEYHWVLDCLKQVEHIFILYDQQWMSEKQVEFEFVEITPPPLVKQIENEYSQILRQLKSFLHATSRKSKTFNFDSREDPHLMTPMNQTLQHQQSLITTTFAPSTKLSQQDLSKTTQSFMPDQLKQKFKQYGDKILSFLRITKNDLPNDQDLEEKHEAEFVLINGLKFLQFESFGRLAEIDIKSTMQANLYSINDSKGYNDLEIYDLSYQKSYNLFDRKKFLLKIYGKTTIYDKIIHIALPYENLKQSYSEQKNQKEYNIQSISKARKTARVAPKESIEWMRHKQAEKVKVSRYWQTLRHYVLCFKRNYAHPRLKQIKSTMKINIFF